MNQAPNGATIIRDPIIPEVVLNPHEGCDYGLRFEIGGYIFTLLHSEDGFIPCGIRAVEDTEWCQVDLGHAWRDHASYEIRVIIYGKTTSAAGARGAMLEIEEAVEAAETIRKICQSYGIEVNLR